MGDCRRRAAEHHPEQMCVSFFSMKAVKRQVPRRVAGVTGRKFLQTLFSLVSPLLRRQSIGDNGAAPMDHPRPGSATGKLMMNSECEMKRQTPANIELSQTSLIPVRGGSAGVRQISSGDEGAGREIAVK